MAKPRPLPEWFSETAQREARKADGPDELFGAAYNEGMRDAEKRAKQEKKTPKTRHQSHGVHSGQFSKVLMRGMRRGASAARKR